MSKTNKLKPKAEKFEDGTSFKTYTHFDRPYSLYKKTYKNNAKLVCAKKTNKEIENIRTKILLIITDKNEIKKHSFYPLIGCDLYERKASLINRYRYESKYYKDKLFNTDSFDEQQEYESIIKDLENKSIEKKRPIRYASHIDSSIYSYYSKILTELYEQKILNLDLDNEILAYRKAPANPNSRRKDNATMAKDVFEEIKRRENNCIAMAFDIQSFYDYIDHKNLKKEWASLLNLEILPADHYNVFKSLTKYCYVDVKYLCEYYLKFKKNRCKENCETCKKPSMSLIPKIAFRTASNFRLFREWCKKNKNNAFKVNEGAKGTNPYGIPQGTPISALLSNIYMLPFDLEMKKLAIEIGGYYRRYSDDILFICNTKDKKAVMQSIFENIELRGKYLKIHEIIPDNRYSKSQCFDFNDKKIKETPFQYLGFEFDGENVRIRKSSMARYYRKSKFAITASYFKARNRLYKLYHYNGLLLTNKHRKLYRKSLYSKYTHKGKNNFIAYANRAFNSVEDIVIQQQIKDHFERFNALLRIKDIQLNKFCDELLEQARKSYSL